MTSWSAKKIPSNLGRAGLFLLILAFVWGCTQPKGPKNPPAVEDLQK